MKAELTMVGHGLTRLAGSLDTLIVVGGVTSSISEPSEGSTGLLGLATLHLGREGPAFSEGTASETTLECGTMSEHLAFICAQHVQHPPGRTSSHRAQATLALIHHSH